MKKYTKLNIRNTKHRTARKAKTVKMKLKKGDTVVVRSGKDKGKQGTILHVYPKESRVLVEGMNVHKRHTRRVGNQSGRIVEKSLSMDASNVMLLDPKEKKPTRVKRVMKEGKLIRVAGKSGTTLA